MEERPYLNPHKDQMLRVGKASDRFEAGVSGTVKAARIEPVMTRQQHWEATFDRGFRSFRDWRSVTWPFRREEMRPPALSYPKTREGIASRAPFMYSNEQWNYAHPVDRRYLNAYESAGERNLVESINTGLWMSATDFVQDWNSHSS